MDINVNIGSNFTHGPTSLVVVHDLLVRSQIGEGIKEQFPDYFKDTESVSGEYKRLINDYCRYVFAFDLTKVKWTTNDLSAAIIEYTDNLFKTIESRLLFPDSGGEASNTLLMHFKVKNNEWVSCLVGCMPVRGSGKTTVDNRKCHNTEFVLNIAFAIIPFSLEGDNIYHFYELQEQDDVRFKYHFYLPQPKAPKEYSVTSNKAETEKRLSDMINKIILAMDKE